MQDSEKFFGAVITTLIVWALGLFWHPFGYPTWLWHAILWILIVFFGFGYLFCVNEEENPEKDQEETEEKD